MTSQKTRYLLCLPHMQPIATHENAAQLSDAHVDALEPFIRWLDTDAPANVDLPECQGFAHLHGYSPARLGDLSDALWTLDVESRIGWLILTAARLSAHAEAFCGVTRGRNRDYRRRVSVDVSDLPRAWQDALADMKAGVERGIIAPAPSIYIRLENRLCMFAHSATAAGRPVSLEDIEALRAFYNDLSSRSAAKNDGTPRFAYLRSAIEELHRFARYCGMDEAVCKRLKLTLRDLGQKEEGQRPKKWVAIDKAPPRNALRDAAFEQLQAAHDIAVPHHRHAARNIALARALSCYDPARPEDFCRHTFGETVSWAEAEGTYRIRYTTRKSRRKSAQTIDAAMPPWMTPFFDGVILQDAPATMLDDLRAKAVRDRRPLIAHYDGSRASYRWYSRVMKPSIGTGAHAMRAILATAAIELMPAGEIAARELLAHRQTKHLKAYVANRRTRVAVATATGILDQRT